MSKDKKKVPRSAGSAERPSRIPRALEEDAGSALQRRPRWSFAILDLEGEFGWRKLQPEALAGLVDRLRNLETMTWNEIRMEGKKQNHSIAVEDCSPAAQKRLREIQQDDVADLFSLRLMGQPRVIGILDRDTFKVLWWDPDHLVCPSILKHT